MKPFPVRTSITVALAAILTTASACAQEGDGSGETSGDVTLTLSQISALTMPGQPDPAHDADCQERYGAWIGQTVETRYEIDPSTLMMSATSTVQGEAVTLYPLGISGIYAFMSDGVPPGLETEGVTRVLFEVTLDFGTPESRVMTELSETVQCLIES